MAKEITVEVAYATPQLQRIITLEVEQGTTAFEAVGLSHIQLIFPEIDPEVNAMGIFSKILDGKGQPTPREYVLKSGDRVEIYRPLIIDPKKARLERAEKRKQEKIDARQDRRDQQVSKT